MKKENGIDEGSESIQASESGGEMRGYPATIAGRKLSMREYSFVEGLHVQQGCQSFLDALFGLFSDASAPPPAEAVRRIFAAHVTNVVWLMAQAITPLDEVNNGESFVTAVATNACWIHTLNDLNGDALLAVWWEVNGGFFTRRIRERMLAKATEESPKQREE